MKKTNVLFLLAFACIAFVTSCKDDDNKSTANSTLTLDIKGLQDLGSKYAYEGWIMVDGKPVSAGVFSVNESGALSKTSFEIDEAKLSRATAYILTVEPSPDSDPNPSKVHILAGDFSGDKATVTVDHSAALGTNFTDATGKYLLATPTDGSGNNELSGVWWFGGLSLPALPAGWKYEGWAVIDGKPITTGKFTDENKADEFDGFSGTTASGPAFPGEDFIMNAPEGFTFPTDLSGGKVVISVEPDPDNSADPFVLKPLIGAVPADAKDHVNYSMDNKATATNPTGSVSR